MRVQVIYQESKPIDAHRSSWKAPPLYYIHIPRTRKEQKVDVIEYPGLEEQKWGVEPFLSQMFTLSQTDPTNDIDHKMEAS